MIFELPDDKARVAEIVKLIIGKRALGGILIASNGLRSSGKVALRTVARLQQSSLDPITVSPWPVGGKEAPEPDMVGALCGKIPERIDLGESPASAGFSHDQIVEIIADRIVEGYNGVVRTEPWHEIIFEEADDPEETSKKIRVMKINDNLVAATAMCISYGLREI